MDSRGIVPTARMARTPILAGQPVSFLLAAPWAYGPKDVAYALALAGWQILSEATPEEPGRWQIRVVHPSPLYLALPTTVGPLTLQDVA